MKNVTKISDHELLTRCTRAAFAVATVWVVAGFVAFAFPLAYLWIVGSIASVGIMGAALAVIASMDFFSLALFGGNIIEGAFTLIGAIIGGLIEASCK